MLVLLVGHDEQAKATYREYLSRFHLEILEAATVEGALEHLVNFEIDILVIELALVRENKWQLAEYVRKELNKSQTDLPIIVLSPIDSLDLQLDYIRYRINDWLGQPVKPLARLLARIWILLGEKGQADAVDQH